MDTASYVRGRYLIAYSKIIHKVLKGTSEFLLILSDISKHQDINSKCPRCHGYMKSVQGQKKFEKLRGGSEKQA